MPIIGGGRRRTHKHRNLSRKTRLGRTARNIKRFANNTLNIVPPVDNATRNFLRNVRVSLGGKRKRSRHRKSLSKTSRDVKKLANYTLNIVPSSENAARNFLQKVRNEVRLIKTGRH